MKKKPEPQWILIRGLARETRHWGDFPQILSKSLGGNARIEGIDLPGTGRYSEMRSPISISEITEFARGKFLELRQRQRDLGEAPAEQTYLLAVSLGGMVAAEWVAQWPDDFAGLVLVNTSFRGYSPFYRRLKPQSLLHFAQILRARNAVSLELEILRMISNRTELRAPIAEAWAKIRASRPISYENFVRQLTAAARFLPPLEKPAIPTLVFVSEKDRMVDPSCSKEIARIWDVEMKTHPTAGHDLALDEPEWLAERVSDWVSHLS